MRCSKVIMQVISEACASFVLQCIVNLSMGGNVNTRRMSQHDMGSIFHIKIYAIFWSWETIMWIIIFFLTRCFYPPRILNEYWYIYSCLQIPPRENWFQYVRRVYTTCIIPLSIPPFFKESILALQRQYL